MTDDALSARPFGFWTTTSLVVGGMIGAGVFVLPAQLAAFGMTGAVGWIVAIAGALVLAWVCAGLNAAHPQSSGLIAITGEALGPLAGVVTGWAYWISVWCSVAVLGMSAATYMGQFAPGLVASPQVTVVTAISIIWLFTLINLAGAHVAGFVQVLTTVLKLLPLVAVLAILAQIAFAGDAHAAASESSHPPFMAGELPSAVNIVFFALLGFESAGIAAERVRDPARTVPRATMAGVMLTGALYLFVCSGIVFALPAAELSASSAPIALFVGTFWGSWAGMAVAAFAVIAAAGCLNGWVLIQGEVPLGMARSGLIPAWLGRVDRRAVPRLLVLASSALASALLLLSAAKSTAGLFDFALRLTATTALFVYLAFCIAALVIGVRRLAALAGLAFSLWAIAGAGAEAAGLSVLLMLTAIPLYLLRPKKPIAAEQAAQPVHQRL